MLPVELPQFTKLADALFAAFDKPSTEARVSAYWIGLKQMQLLQFEEVVQHVIGFDGEDELPTPKQLYSISRRLRNAKRAAELAGRKSAAAPSDAPKPEPDVFERYANRVLLGVLCELIAQHRSAATDESLAQMVQVKRRLANDYRDICVEEPDACSELRDKLLVALRPCFVPREVLADAPQRLSVPAAGETWAAALASLETSNAIGGQNAPPDSPQWGLL
jgi:hypothetical protein